MISIEEIINDLKGIKENTASQIFYPFYVVNYICDFSYFIWHFGNKIYISINIDDGIIKLSMRNIKDKENTHLLTSLKLPGIRKIKFNVKKFL